MPERDVERLAEATGHATFRTFAEWLKENRTMWEAHLRAQDEKLAELHVGQQEIKADLKDTKSEVKLTNGRVTRLEQKDSLYTELAKSKGEWERERSSADKETAKLAAESNQRQSDKAWRVITLAVSVLGGGLLASLGHAAGWW